MSALGQQLTLQRPGEFVRLVPTADLVTFRHPKKRLREAPARPKLTATRSFANAFEPQFGRCWLRCIDLGICRFKPHTKEATMRLFALAALAIAAFVATMTIDRTDANAVVCARGPYRAGCVGARGAVVVHPYVHPYARPYRYNY